MRLLLHGVRIPLVTNTEGIKYLLRDEFTIALAAGSVNGTAAEPGPGTRNSTNTLVAISGGKIITTGDATWGHAGWYLSPGITRVAGKIVIGNFNAENLLAGGIFGLSSAIDFSQTGGNNVASYILLNGTLCLRKTSDATSPAIYAFTPGTNYPWAVILRATGKFVFIKDTTWKLLFIDDWVNTATLYLGTSVHTNGKSLSEDFSRVSTTLWLPSPLLSTSGAMTWPTTNGLGHAETTGLGSGGSGLTMLEGGTTWSVAGGYVLNTPTLGPELAAGNLEIGKWYLITATEVNHFYAACAINDKFRAAAATALDANNKVKLVTNTIANSQLSTTDVLAEMVIHAFTLKNQCGLALNMDAAGANGVLCYFDGAGNIKLDEIVNGTYTNRLSAAVAFVADKRLIVRKVGTEYRVFYNEALVGTTSLVDAAAMAGQYHGLFSTLTANTITSMVVYPTGKGNEHGILDKFSR